jgi:hypothetical protein
MTAVSVLIVAAVPLGIAYLGARVFDEGGLWVFVPAIIASGWFAGAMFLQAIKLWRSQTERDWPGRSHVSFREMIDDLRR